MAENLTTTTEVDPAVATFYDRTLLSVAKPKLVHEKWAQKRPIPQKSGNTIKFRRYGTLSKATTPITEGVTPPGQKMSKSDLTAQIAWFGDYVHVTYVVDMTVEDPELTVAAERLGQQMGETRDELIRDILIACASVTHASNGSNADTPTEITKDDVDAIVKTLLGNNADMVAPQITAGRGEGTYPIRAAYWGIMHTDLVDDLEDVSNFKSISEYPRQQAVDDAEWGSTGNLRWVLSSEAHKDANGSSLSADQYKLPVIGKNAYGVTDLSGTAVKNIVKQFGSGGTSDPLNQRATSGWKMALTGRILNDSFMHVLEVTHS